MPDTNNTNFTDPTGITDALGKLIEQLKITSDSFKVGFENVEGGALALNKQLGQSRQRITELKMAVADATPVVDRLGGTLYDAVETTRQISEATRRNVIASADDVGKLYAAGQILGKGVGDIVESFQDIGVQFSQVGSQLEDSIDYIQSVGVNTKQVMDKVMENMSQMNRFNFQDGVQGLTKMATQATLLKFDMGQVFTLADKALDPQGAIELSSAFQRLGLAAGGLTDPFELMYKSLNDPEGLQNSLVEMTKQFTYFDEQTKSFKISPAGMLQLRELQNQTGISAAEMSKLALNTADLDRKLSMIKPELKFATEEDKMYLANIAKMDAKTGSYKVEFVDERGNQVSKNIEDLSQEQLDMLIEQEKTRPKDLESIQRSQLQNIEVMGGDLRAIRDKIVYGTVTAPKLTMLAEDIGKIGTIVTDTLNKGVDQKEIQGTVNKTIGEVRDIFKDMAAGKKVDWTDLQNITKDYFDFDKLKEKIMSYGPEIREKIPQTIKNRYDIPDNMGDIMGKFFNKLDIFTKQYEENAQRPTRLTRYEENTQRPTRLTQYDTQPQRPPKTKPADPNVPVTTMNVEHFNIGDTSLNDLMNSMVNTNRQDPVQNKMQSIDIKFPQIMDVETLNIANSSLTEILNNIANRPQKITIDGIDRPSMTTMTAQQAIVKSPMNDNQTLHKHTFDGTITWKIDAPPELDTKRFYAMIDRQEFKDTFTKIVIDKFKETEGTPLSNNA